MSDQTDELLKALLTEVKGTRSDITKIESRLELVEIKQQQAQSRGYGHLGGEPETIASNFDAGNEVGQTPTLIGPDGKPVFLPREKRMTEEQARAKQAQEEMEALSKAVDQMHIDDPRLRQRFGVVGGGGRLS